MFNFNSSFLVSIQIENEQVYIEQLGANSSYINQIPLERHVRQALKDEDKLHLLEKEFGYTIRIRQDMVDSSSPKRSTLKRQNTDESERSSKKQAVGTEEEDENRSEWIQQQLMALQANANQSYVLPILPFILHDAIQTSNNIESSRKTRPSIRRSMGKAC